MNREIVIGNRTVGQGHPPFVIAEMSGNHNQSLERALQLVDEAAKAGAHALKLQTYTADTMTLNLSEGEFFISDPASLWHGRSLYDLYQEAHTPWDWHAKIFERCQQLGMVCFSTPFDETAVDFLETLNAPCYKIASFENTDLPLIRKVALTGKPIIISTGMASISEMHEMVATVKETGNQNIILLKCTSTYPASPEHTNLASIPHMREMLGVLVGLSDHTLGIGVAVASVAFGAAVIEKHFTIDRMDGGVDSAFSIEPKELAALVTESERAFQGIGTISYTTSNNENRSKLFRRSLYLCEDVKQGEMLTAHNVRRVRPANGLPSKYFDLVLGLKVRKDLKKGTPVTWDVFKP